jgi:SAM-dependent methyltransferase
MVDIKGLSAWGKHVGEEARKSFSRYLADGFIAKYLSGESILDIGYRGYIADVRPIVPQAVGIDLDYPGYDGVTLPFADNSQDAVFSSHTLEHIVDYRTTLRDWFRVVKAGGHMVIAVPHQYLYERRLRPPSRFNWDHKRFYTPAILLMQVEEALDPLTYRVRLLEDNDCGFDYSIPPERHAGGCYEIVLVVQKIERPDWADTIWQTEPAAEPPEKFSPQLPKDLLPERIATVIPHPGRIKSVLVTKLDHRGDFNLAKSALRIVGTAFRDAKLTLACGPWNRQAAEELDMFDEIVPFSFFPEDVSLGAPPLDLRDSLNRFENLFKGRKFDVAVDLRIDPDTRPLLERVDAVWRAGFGYRRVFPFLDISLPFLNPTYSLRAERVVVPAKAFRSVAGRRRRGRITVGDPRNPLRRLLWRIRRKLRDLKGKPRLSDALVCGPWRPIDPGSYLIEPLIDGRGETFELSVDIAASGRVLLSNQRLTVSAAGVAPPLSIDFDEPLEDFEIRINGDLQPRQRFDFRGLAMTKKGGHDSFHQEEALAMLSVLTALRTEFPHDVLISEAGA